MRIEAIRAAGGLANALKEARVGLCEEFDRCLVPPKIHAERDQALTDVMAALFKLWNGRRFADAEEVRRFTRVGLRRAVRPRYRIKRLSHRT